MATGPGPPFAGRESHARGDYDLMLLFIRIWVVQSGRVEEDEARDGVRKGAVEDAAPARMTSSEKAIRG